MTKKPEKRRADGTVELLRERFGLTLSEASVAMLVADGLMYAEIAERLAISPHTVHTHVKEVHRKLDVHSNGRAAALIRELEVRE